MNKNMNEELGERVIAALWEENSGVVYKRQHVVSERAIDARFLAAEKKVDLCPFVNRYGYCKLDAGHQGSHTVLFLGDDTDAPIGRY